MQQAGAGFKRYGKCTRRERFPEAMEQVVPWEALYALIEPVYYPKRREAGRRPVGTDRMLRIYFLQQWPTLNVFYRCSCTGLLQNRDNLGLGVPTPFHRNLLAQLSCQKTPVPTYLVSARKPLYRSFPVTIHHTFRASCSPISSRKMPAIGLGGVIGGGPAPIFGTRP